MESERAQSSQPPRVSSPAGPLREPSLAVASLTAAAAAVAVYLSGLHNPFVYDDHRMIVENASIRQVQDLWALVSHEMTRPLANLSYAVDYARSGLQPFGYHATNLALHVVNVLLLARVSWRLSRDGALAPASGEAAPAGLVALTAALVFAVHPMMSSAVAYIAARPELLCAALVQAAFLAGRRWLLGGGWTWALGMVAAWLLALAAKEVAVMFPFVLLLYDWLFLNTVRAESRWRRRWTHGVLMATTAAAGWARLAVLMRTEYPGAVVVGWSLVPLQFDVVVRYLVLLVAPNGQTVFHAVAAPPWLAVRTWIEIGAVALLAGGALRLRPSLSAIGFGVGWFLLLLVPSAVLVALDRAEPMAEHRVYSASLGVCLVAGAAVGWLAPRAPRWSPLLAMALRAVGVMLLLSLAGRTVLRNAMWASPIGLWSEAVAKAPDSWLPHQLLGEALLAAGRHEDAVGAFRTVMRLRPEEPAAYQKLALCYLEMGRVPDATAAFEALRAIDPRSAIAANGLGAIALVSGQPEQAKEWFQRALAVDPNNVPAREALASITAQPR